VTATSPNPPGSDASVRRYEPLAPAALAFVVGILIGEFLGGGMFLWCAVAGGAAVTWVVLRLRGVRDRTRLAPLLVLILAAGAARYRSSVEPPPDDAARLIAEGSRVAVLEGIVVRSPHQTPPPKDVFLPPMPYYVRSKLILACERAKVDGRWVPARGRIHTSIRSPLPEAGEGVLHLGDRVRVLGRLMRPMPPANPGTFDMPTYFRRQGVRACLYTDHWEAVTVVEPGADPLRWVVGAMGRWAVRRFERIRSPEGRAVAAAIVLGRRDLLRFDAGQTEQTDIERAFVVTGTAHFLAVSGFSVGLAAAVVLLVARLLGLGPRPTAILVAVVVLTYAMMTELRPPVVRAAILIWILCAAWMLGRERMRLNSLAAAVLVILLIRPGDLFTTSFQLSFVVVLGMFWLVGKVERTVFRRRPDDELLTGSRRLGAFSVVHYLRQTAALSVSAALVAVPLVAYRFHLVGWLAPIGSVVLAPLVFVLIAGSMALVVLGAAAPWLGDLLAAVPDGMARAIVGVVTALARVPGGHFYTAGFSWLWLVVVYGLLAAWVWRERIGLSRRRLAIGVLAVAGAFLWSSGHRAPRQARATFLSVGSGNTNLLELPNGRNVLYDAGSSLSYARAAEAAIAPALWSRGIERIDAVFLSHAHFDHFKDVLPLVERFGVQRVFVPPTFLRKRLNIDNAVVEALLARGADVTLFGAGDRLAGTGETRIRAVWPRGAASMTREINDGSLVLEVFDHSRWLLLTGDLEPPGMDALMKAEPFLRTDLMLWPHHGQADVAVRRLVRHTGAEVLVVSAARSYRPRPMPKWLWELEMPCFHTGVLGAVTVDVVQGGLKVRTFRGGVHALTGPTPGPEQPVEE